MIFFTILGILLKIIGIVLLSLLGLVVLLLILFLTVPLRYRVKINRDGDNTRAEAKVSYLGGLLRVPVLWENGRFDFSIRILWFRLFSGAGKKDGKNEETDRKNEETDEKNEETDRENGETADEGVEETVRESETATEDSESSTEKASEDCDEGFFAKTRKKINRICSRLNLISEFLAAKENKNALKKTGNAIFRLLKYLLPYKIKGKLIVGTGDPYSMGQLLSILGILYPTYAKKLDITADFEAEKLRIEGSVLAVGRIRPGRLIYELLRFLWKAKGFRVLKNIRKLKKDLAQAN